MKHYRARPIEIDALLWQGNLDEVPQEWHDRGLVITFEVDTGALFTKTLQGPSRADIGEHYLIPNLQPEPDPDKDEVYPVAAHVFERRYEPVQP